MKRVLLPFSLILILLVAACGNRGSEPQASEKEIPAPTLASQELPPVEPPALDEGIIAFITGEADIADESGWFPAEIGDLLTSSDRIRTAADSICEIQFGSIAVIKLQENTEVDISRINLTPESSKIGIAMTAGTVLSKVRKLSGADSFSIRTQSAVCGVRGTEFSVTTDASGQSIFAVKEGSVAILPPDIDTEGLKEQLAGQDAEAKKLIDQMIETALRVEADQEIAVGPEFVEETREAVKSINRSVTEVAAAETPIEREEKTRALAAATMQTSQIIRTESAAPTKISPEKTEVLKQTEKMRIREIPVAAIKGERTEIPKVRLHRVAVKVHPEDARILLNGEIAGKGNYSALFEEGSSLSFTLEKDGYTDYRLAISVSSESAKLYTVELAALSSETSVSPAPQALPAPPGPPEPPAPASASAAVGPRAEVPTEPLAQSEAAPQPAARIEPEIRPQPEPSTEPRPAPAGPSQVRVSVTASPADAAVQLGNDTRRTGRISIEAMPGDRISVTVSRRGFAEEKITLEVGDSPLNRHVVLQGQPVLFRSSVSEEAVIGLTAADNLVIVSDARGKLSALDLDGKLMWQTESSNRPNENNHPVIVGSKVIFSGSRELLIADLSTGKELQRIPLDSSRSHLFGRRTVPYQDKILYPSNKSLDFLDPATGSFSRFADLGPTGSRMSPGIYRDMVLIADQEGTLNIIDSDGVLEARIPTGALQPLALAVSVHDGLAVFSGRRGDVVCLDLRTRSVLWEKTLGDTGVSVASDIEVSDSGIYPYGMVGTIYGLDRDDGTELFSPIHGAATPPSVLNEGRQFIYGTRDRKLILADSQTGTTLRSLKLEDQPSARPVIIPGDTLIALGTKQGRILLIEPEGMR